MKDNFETLAKKIYKDVIEYSKNNKKTLKSMTRDIGIPYTTFVTWIYKLKKGKIISLEGIKMIEETISKRYIFFWLFYTFKTNN